MKQLKTLVPLALLLGLISWLRAEPPGTSPNDPGPIPAPISSPALPPMEEERQIIVQALIVRMPLNDRLLNGNPSGLNIGVIKGTNPLDQIRPLKPEVLSRPQIRTLNGRSSTIAFGQEVLAQGADESPSNAERFLAGTTFEILPRILKEEKIRMRFKWEQTTLSEAASEDKEKESATHPGTEVLTTGFINEGMVTASVGETVVISHPDRQSPDKDGVRPQFFIFLTPKIIDETPKILPASVAPRIDARSFSVVEIQTKPARISHLRGDQRADLWLEVSETGVIESPEKVRSVSVTGGRDGIITVTAEGNRQLQIQAKHVGTATLLVTDIEGREYSAFVQVKPALGTNAVKDMLSRLFPSAQVEVIALNESLLLRGSVTKAADLTQITEIAEQYAPKVLNHLVVDDGLSPVNPFELPPGMRYQSVRAILLNEEEARKQGNLDTRYVKADLEMEWTEVVEGKAVKRFKPLLKRVAVVSIEKQPTDSPYPSDNPTPGSPAPGPEVKEPTENQMAQVVLIVTPDQFGLLQLAGRSSRLRVRFVEPGVGPIPVGQVNRDTERLLRGAVATTDPVSGMMGMPGTPKYSQPNEKSEVQELREEVKSLHNDVKRLIEILERKAAGDSTHHGQFRRDKSLEEILKERKLANDYFESQPWVASAKYTLRTEDAYLYFDEWIPSERDKKTVQFKPFAMIQIPKEQSSDAKPFGITCDSASLKFTTDFQLMNSNSYTIEEGTLTGLVRAVGDAGLKVIGEDLEYSKIAP